MDEVRQHSSNILRICVVLLEWAGLGDDVVSAHCAVPSVAQVVEA